jgi:hypothetical protein
MAAAAIAGARTHKIVPYPFTSVWPTAIRFIKLDRGWKLVEQDREAGYLRFVVIEDKKPHPATLELVRVNDAEGRDAVRLQLSSADLAGFQEVPILDGLAHKLKEELGPAAPGKRPNPAEHAPPDASTE